VVREVKKGVNKMDTTRNILQKGVGAFEYARLLDSANQISVFGEPVKELSKDELLAALIFTMQSNQEPEEQQKKEKSYTNLPPSGQRAGLW
jgi:hypothetical protein